ncbi:hypothetical protein CEXT_254811 [Caerostris extrusa]|uniref:Uncharacterized protein n=1 Tax=Caerostris extrusa TaxID=172846 RepID=A0AAV4QVJ3_CAEEX|nr:hypothetical protein CEXT_254811 [Caerostris extrusa]
MELRSDELHDILEDQYLRSKLPFGMSLDKTKKSSDTLLTINDDPYEREEGTNMSYRPPYRQNRITLIIHH